jgi:5-methylcytosine-specific restriction endonuclease McrA
MLTPSVPRSRRWASRQRRKGRIRTLVASVKVAGVCALCGVPAGRSLTFHHLGPRRFYLANAAHHTAGAVLQEIAGTCLLCNPCHQGLHAGRIDGSRLTPIVLDSTGGRP